MRLLRLLLDFARRAAENWPADHLLLIGDALLVIPYEDGDV
jgi:hypothetical protein